MKINEFVNNDELLTKFNKLKKNSFYETSHLSDTDEMSNSNSYKEILSYGHDIVPIIMDEITNKNGSYTLCSIVFNIVGDINIPDSDKGYVVK